MNSIVKKYIVINQDTDESKKFDKEIDACNYIRSQEAGAKFLIMHLYESAEPKDLKFRATIVLVVYQAPQRTIRAIESCLAQDTTGIEIIVYGDCCPHLNSLIKRGYFDNKIIEQQLKGNDLVVVNNEENYGGFGYVQRNRARDISRGAYTFYVDGDDVILPNHVATRLEIAETNQYDMIGFDTWIEPKINWKRDALFERGKIGNAEIIIRTEFLKTLPLMDSAYEHDWRLIEAAIHRGARYTIKSGKPYTYIVKSLPNCKEQGID